jgi:chromosomal replication initiation ATPase DnaA
MTAPGAASRRPISPDAASMRPGSSAEVSARQLALPFAYIPRFRVEDFIPAPSNEEARAWLGRTADWPASRLALYGEAGCGKTHLLQLWAERHGALLLGGPSLRRLPELGGSPAIALDDADAAPDETTLLHLVNLAGEMRRPLLMAGRVPPARARVRLPDLASRLRSMTAVALRPAEEPLLRALFTRLLSDRQLVLAESLQDWLLARLPRHPAALREAVARLDREAMAAGGRVTRGMAAVLVEAVGDEPGGHAVGDVSDNSVNDVCTNDPVLL